MKTENKGCLVAFSCCAFAIWGALLNGWITSWLWRVQHGNQRIGYDVPFIPACLGMVLGFITASLFFLNNAKSTLRCGFLFLFIITALCVFDACTGRPLLMCLDIYGFSFLWALSLIAIGYILRSLPNNRMN